MRTRSIATIAVLMMGWLFAGCLSPAPSEQKSSAARSGEPSFINKVWRVQMSNAIPAGLLYTFLSEGTLVIASRNNPAALGTWTRQDGRLTMIEEGIPHAVEVLELTHDRFKIRMEKPGKPVEITFIPAARTE
jgi:hypothetical protein